MLPDPITVLHWYISSISGVYCRNCILGRSLPIIYIIRDYYNYGWCRAQALEIWDMKCAFCVSAGYNTALSCRCVFGDGQWNRYPSLKLPVIRNKHGCYIIGYISFTVNTAFSVFLQIRACRNIYIFSSWLPFASSGPKFQLHANMLRMSVATLKHIFVWINDEDAFPSKGRVYNSHALSGPRFCNSQGIAPVLPNMALINLFPSKGILLSLRLLFWVSYAARPHRRDFFPRCAKRPV